MAEKGFSLEKENAAPVVEYEGQSALIPMTNGPLQLLDAAA